MVELLEELEDVRLYDQVKNDNDPSIPIEDAFEMIEANRKGNSDLPDLH